MSGLRRNILPHFVSSWKRSEKNIPGLYVLAQEAVGSANNVFTPSLADFPQKLCPAWKDMASLLRRFVGTMGYSITMDPKQLHMLPVFYSNYTNFLRRFCCAGENLIFCFMRTESKNLPDAEKLRPIGVLSRVGRAFGQGIR